MKNLCQLLLLLLIIVASNSFAQSPSAIPYQAVARDNAGNLIANQSISLRFSIHDATAGGTVLYQETQMAMTNSLGLFTTTIGQGMVITGTFSGINWGVNAKFVQVEMDASGGSTYIDMGTTQLMSVPYALYAARSGDIPAGSANGNTLRWNGTTWISDNAVFNNGVNVGIGTPSPAAKLDVAGTVKIADGTQGAGKVLTSNASGVASWQAASGGATYRWVSFHSYDPNFGFYFGNDLNMFGG
ncbi:MAG: hypothetical protein IPP86_01530 [Bacteroidetes bacterium]|nr:hypothetical protein [Bacteroidota bacterium]